MSLLTYLTAPYAVGCFYQVWKKQRPLRYLLVAIALCLFSSSWFYDGYLLLRDGLYTARWFGNLLVSPIIYMAAGLLWNLELGAGNRIVFSFLRVDWPHIPSNKSWRGLVGAMLPLILIAAVSLVAFVGWR